MKAIVSNMKILNSFLTLMFLAFALVQLNDPDPLIWILIYVAMAIISGMAFFEFYIPKLMWTLTFIYVGYAIVLFPGVWKWANSPDRALLFDDIAKMQNLYIEEAREFLGLLICLLALAFYAFRASRQKYSV